MKEKPDGRTYRQSEIYRGATLLKIGETEKKIGEENIGGTQKKIGDSTNFPYG